MWNQINPTTCLINLEKIALGKKCMILFTDLIVKIIKQVSLINFIKLKNNLPMIKNKLNQNPISILIIVEMEKNMILIIIKQ